jgi:hypothetical protein
MRHTGTLCSAIEIFVVFVLIFLRVETAKGTLSARIVQQMVKTAEFVHQNEESNALPLLLMTKVGNLQSKLFQMAPKSYRLRVYPSFPLVKLHPTYQDLLIEVHKVSTVPACLKTYILNRLKAPLVS